MDLKKQMQPLNPFYPKLIGKKIDIEAELKLLKLEAERLEAWASGRYCNLRNNEIIYL